MVVQNGIMDRRIARFELKFDISTEPQAILAACAFWVLAILEMVCCIAAVTHSSGETNALFGWMIRTGILVPGKVLFSTLIAAWILSVDHGDLRRRRWVGGAIGLMALLVSVELIALLHTTSAPLLSP